MKLFRQAYEQDNGLPVGYTEIEYLESTGTQWIDTGVIRQNGILKVETNVQYTNTGNRQLWGYCAGGGAYIDCSATGLLGLGGDYTLPTSISAYDWNIINYECSSYPVSGQKLTGTLSCGSDLITRTNNIGTYVPLNGFVLFATKSTDTTYDNLTCSMKMKYCKIYDNDILVRDFIPVLDGNMKPCMYDKVSRKMFYNQGTGEFIAGRQIYLVEYLENTAKNWINTNFIPTNDNVKWETCISFNSTSAAQLMGSGYAGSTRFNFGIDSTKKFRFGFGSSWYDADPSVYTPDTNKHVWVLEGNTKTGSIDGVSVTFDQSYNPNGKEPIVFFARSMTPTTIQDSNWPKAKIYYSKIWSEGVLVRDCIPAIDENGVGFMFDKVTHTIFDNAGSGSFTYGKEITKYKTRLGFVRFGKKPTLPEGFTEVEYLESTGTQYIDTGITQNSNIKAELSVYPTAINKFIFGSRISTGSGAFGIFMHSDNSGSWYPLFSSSKSMISGFVVNKNYNIEFSKDGFIVNNELLQGPYTQEFTGDLNIYLFAMNSNGAVDNRLFIGKIYSAKLYENDVLVRDYVPCLDASNFPCMYDKVEGKAYYSQSTDAFLYGEKKSAKYALAAPKVVIEVPLEYKRLNYIESTGTQYINTGIVGTNENIGIDVNWAFSNNDANMCIFSSRSAQTSQTLTLFWLKTAANRIRFDAVGQKYFTEGVNTSVSADIFNFNYKSADGAVATLTNKTEGQIQTLAIGKLTVFSSKPLYLFASKDTADTYSWIKMYRCKIYDGDTTVRDFVPVLRRSDNKPGMYDTINKIFYVNTASGADFNYG